MEKRHRVFVLFLLVGVAVLCESRVVKVPAGPLVRVEGQSVSIRCNVSDYQGPRDQDFEWAMILDNGNEVPLVSTFDPAYPDPSVKDRVASGDISVKKLSDDSAELGIRKLRASDSAIYRCSTPSTDSVSSGNYQADVELRVIGDSLKVVPAVPQPAVSEGDSLELQCNASRAYTAHTFLSVTLSIKKGTNPPEEILTFGPDGGMKVGQNYVQRYSDGGLILDLRGDGFYGLLLKGVKPLDQGTYVCTAREWTREPGGKGWHKILERSEEMGTVTVTPLELISVKAGADHTFTPKVTGQTETILWKYQSNKLVEYEADDVTWFRFKGRGTLDVKTGDLILQGLTKTESGLYEAEIQVAGKLQVSKYEVTVIDPVSKPAVTWNVRSTDEATLLCSVDRGDQAVFEWSGPNELRGSGGRLDVSKEESRDAVFICTAKNNVSENSVEFAFNKCFKGKAFLPKDWELYCL